MWMCLQHEASVRVVFSTATHLNHGQDLGSIGDVLVELGIRHIISVHQHVWVMLNKPVMRRTRWTKLE